MPRLPTLLFLLATAGAAPAADDRAARFDAALAAAERGERAAAIAGFAALAAEEPDRPEALNNLAALHAAQGELARARELLERALRTDPAYATAHDNLRAVYAALAADAYRKALPLEGVPPPPTLALLSRPVEPLAVAATVPEAPAAPAPRPVPMTTPTVSYTVAAATDRHDAAAFAAFEAVAAWARAWSAREPAGYLAAYAPQFVPPDGLSRGAWEAQRAARIRAPQRIAIEISGRHLVLDADGGRARLSFVQRYRSDRFNGDSFKTLTLVQHQGRWLIAAERTGR